MQPLLKRSLRLVEQFEDALLVVALVTLLGMAVFQILLRNLFDSGLFWADSFVRVLVLWVAMLGAMVATREQRHISIDLLSRPLSPRARGRVGRVVALGSGLICAIAAWYCARFVAIEMEAPTLAFWLVPNWACELVLPLGFGVMALRFVAVAIVGPRTDPPSGDVGGEE